MNAPSLWRDGDFRNVYVWIAQTVSLLGSQISTLALPLVPINTLQATPMQMGLLIALNSLLQGMAPIGALVGGLVGEWVGLRPTLILASIGELTALLWLWAVPMPMHAETKIWSHD